MADTKLFAVRKQKAFADCIEKRDDYLKKSESEPIPSLALVHILAAASFSAMAYKIASSEAPEEFNHAVLADNAQAERVKE